MPQARRAIKFKIENSTSAVSGGQEPSHSAIVGEGRTTGGHLGCYSNGIGLIPLRSFSETKDLRIERPWSEAVLQAWYVAGSTK